MIPFPLLIEAVSIKPFGSSFEDLAGKQKVLKGDVQAIDKAGSLGL